MRKSIFIMFLFLAGKNMAQEQALFKETHRPQYHFSPAKQLDKRSQWFGLL
jgi:hypothetical protein